MRSDELSRTRETNSTSIPKTNQRHEMIAGTQPKSKRSVPTHRLPSPRTYDGGNCGATKSTESMIGRDPRGRQRTDVEPIGPELDCIPCRLRVGICA